MIVAQRNAKFHRWLGKIHRGANRYSEASSGTLRGTKRDHLSRFLLGLSRRDPTLSRMTYALVVARRLAEQNGLENR